MSRWINRRTLLASLAFLLLAIFVPPFINVSRFRPRIAGALSNGLGRPVSIESVSLRLLPRPGLNLSRLTVQDDPAFSAEPMLRADEVTATLRLTSLWRGRLEIARLSLSYPSLNLVRRADGRWNLEALLERARQIPTAPTTKRRPEARLRFPYIEADGGRINLKIGQEKTVYALSDADFALWLPSENQWRLRLAARPIRTDANLSDTGRLRISGSIERGSSLSDTPVVMSMELERAQLGQLTTLIYGRDRGWRGAVSLAATFNGTPADLKISGDVSVSDFRRYDLATSGDLRLAAQCTAAFHSTEQRLSDVACRAPVGNGAMALRGEMAGFVPAGDFVFTGSAQQVPAGSLIALARCMKKDLPPDLSAAGTVSADIEVRRSAGAIAWTGGGATEDLELRSSSTTPLRLGEIKFRLEPPGTEQRGPKWVRRTMSTVNVLRVDPFAVDLGAVAPARAQASFSREEYSVAASGEADLPRLLQVSGMLGIASPPITATGTAKVDLRVGGNWASFAQPLVTGTAQVRASAKVAGINAPVQITSAALSLDPQAITARNLTISFPGTHVALTGSVSLPRRCFGTGQCRAEFQLAGDSLSGDDLNVLLNPAAVKRPWWELIGGGKGVTSSLMRLTAHGQVNLSRVALSTLIANRVTGEVTLDHGILEISGMRADLVGGRATGELRADFIAAQPAYAGSGRVEGASVAALASLTNDSWGTGRISAAYTFALSGLNAAQLRESATGSLDFDWRDGTLSDISLGTNAAPLRINAFRGQVSLRAGRLTFAPSKMETAAGIYVVSGTASLDRKLGLGLARGKNKAFEITGTLDKPRVVTLAGSATQAALKQ